MSHHLTVCVPVHNGRAFVAETLTAIQRQRYQDLTILISDDGSDDGSPDICRGFTTDSRVRLTIQPSRLGWIENCNWLLGQADGEFVCLVSHDDIPEPDHMAQLVSCFTAHPGCVLAFTDIRVFGLLDHVEHQDSVFGTPAERVRAFIAGHFDGTAFHGLICRRALEAVGGLRGNQMDHFAADVSWLGRLAQAGEFRRVPEALYRKRRSAGSASMKWGDWSDEVKTDAWGMHCRELLRDALRHALTPDEQRLLISAVLRRLLAIEPTLPFPSIRALPRPRLAALVAALFEELRASSNSEVRALGEEDPHAVLARLLGEEFIGPSASSV